MEAILSQVAGPVADAADLACVLCIAIGGIGALFRAGRALVLRNVTDRHIRRTIWRGFAGWIVLALEFALAADIVDTAIAPTWEDIGRLAAIAAIRTGLNYFLEKDLEAMEPKEAQPTEVVSA